jgi:hypothetical protein
MAKIEAEVRKKLLGKTPQTPEKGAEKKGAEALPPATKALPAQATTPAKAATTNAAGKRTGATASAD